jgi:5-formyltetrahydrofolate cyclo-ligase
MQKEVIRQKILERRRDLTSEYMEDAAENLFEQIIGIEQVRLARNVLIYSNFDNEVKTAKLAGWLLYKGKEVFLPTVKEKAMYAMNIRSSPLEPNKFGVIQPRFTKEHFIVPSALDLVIVPGIAFDREKNRIGYGAGYYDDYLKQAKNAYRLALAYDFQIVKKIPAAENDVMMDLVLTPGFSIV